MQKVMPVGLRDDSDGETPRGYQSLPALITDATDYRDPQMRVALATEINELLSTIRQPGDEAEVAAVLVRELDGTRLDSLVDNTGRPCRAVAVQQLLALGFPYALQIAPKDLALARKALDADLGLAPSPPPEFAPMSTGAYALVLIGVMCQAASFFHGAPTKGLIVASLLCMGAGGLAYWIENQRRHRVLTLEDDE